VLTYAGEEDLLAHYMLNLDLNGQHFIGTADPSVDGVMIGEGEWSDFAKSPLYLRRKKADENSYRWDKIIQRTCQNALDGTFIASGDVANGRSSILELAKEPRYFRRALADKMIEAIRNFPLTGEPIMRRVSAMPSADPKKRYVFLLLDVAATPVKSRAPAMRATTRKTKDQALVFFNSLSSSLRSTCALPPR